MPYGPGAPVRRTVPADGLADDPCGGGTDIPLIASDLSEHHLRSLEESSCPCGPRSSRSARSSPPAPSPSPPRPAPSPRPPRTPRRRTRRPSPPPRST
ncbi:hypothetical protein ADL35_38965, partial [Streptomyces sp. NRRL WC-3753]